MKASCHNNNNNNTNNILNYTVYTHKHLAALTCKNTQDFFLSFILWRPFPSHFCQGYATNNDLCVASMIDTRLSHINSCLPSRWKQTKPNVRWGAQKTLVRRRRRTQATLSSMTTSFTWANMTYTSSYSKWRRDHRKYSYPRNSKNIPADTV